MYFLLIGIVLYLFYLYSTRNHSYWKKRGIKYENPLPLFGGSLKQTTNKVNLSERFAKLYRQYPDDKFVGFFEGNTQGLLVKDPEMIKRILITDFRNFHFRGANFHKECTEPLMMNLFNIDGDTWKLLRQNLTPTFTSGKLKAMFPLIVERAEKLLKIADSLAQTGDEVDIRELMARYTTDFIGACGFGIDVNTLNDESSNFRKIGKRIFIMTKRDIIVNILKAIAPDLFKNLHYIPPEVENQIIILVKQIVEQRNHKPVGRNDFIDLLLELQQKGKIVGESIDKRNPDGSRAAVDLEFDDVVLAAQAFIFFAAGFETSSSASSFLLHLLAYYPEEQARCQKEVDDVLKRYDGKLCFDAVRDMKYLEMAFKESIRILPSPGFLQRRSVAKYNFPGTDLTIDSETMIMISLEAMNHDEQYFEDPEEFRPNRFHPDNIDRLKKCVYIPFGDGPRACIGERLGLMQSLAGIASVLSKFSVMPSKSSVRKPVIDPTSELMQIITGGLPLALGRR